MTVAGCVTPAEAPTADTCAGAELNDDPPLMAGSDSVHGCLAYGWTRVLVGSGTFASVAPDGTVAALSNVSGSRWVTVLSRYGETLGSFSGMRIDLKSWRRNAIFAIVNTRTNPAARCVPPSSAANLIPNG